MDKRKRTANTKAAGLKISVDALKMCKNFINDFLDLYYNKELPKHQEHARTIAMCIGDCYRSFNQNFAEYQNNNTTAQTQK